MGRDIFVDRAHHLPGTSHLHVTRVLLHREPPPGDRHARDHDPAVALLLRALLHPDIHEGELVTVGLEPEVDGVLLLGLVLVVEDDVGEPAIALHAAHDLDLLEHEVEIGVELGVMEDEGAVLRPLGDRCLDRLVHVLFAELLAALGLGGDRSGVCRRTWLVCRTGLVPREHGPTNAQGHGDRRGLRNEEAPIKPAEDHWLDVPCPFSGAGEGSLSAAFAAPSTMIACADSIFPFRVATSVAVWP